MQIRSRAWPLGGGRELCSCRCSQLLPGEGGRLRILRPDPANSFPAADGEVSGQRRVWREGWGWGAGVDPDRGVGNPSPTPPSASRV